MSTTDKDDELSRAYRAAANEEPPAALDEAIRAAARRAVQARPQSTAKKWVPRWGSPFAAAAVIMLAVSLLFVAVEERPEVASPEMQVSQPREIPIPAVVPEVRIVEEARREAAAPLSSANIAASAPKANRPAPLAKDKTNPAVADLAETGRGRSEPALESPGLMAQGKLEKPAAPSAYAPPAAPPSPMAIAGMPAEPLQARDKLTQMEAKELAARQSVVDITMKSKTRTEFEAYSEAHRSDAPVAAAPARSAPMAAPVASARSLAPPPSAADWLKRIEELRAQGKLKEVREELAKFRKQYPDVELPKALAELPAE
ncbi:MAG TPA: hypothetical protein VF928_13225 [Usitatibacteraceae bacterium]